MESQIDLIMCFLILYDRLQILCLALQCSVEKKLDNFGQTNILVSQWIR